MHLLNSIFRHTLITWKQSEYIPWRQTTNVSIWERDGYKVQWFSGAAESEYLWKTNWRHLSRFDLKTQDNTCHQFDKNNPHPLDLCILLWTFDLFGELWSMLSHIHIRHNKDVGTLWQVMLRQSEVEWLKTF